MSEEKEIQRDDPMMAAEYALGLLEGEDLLTARGKMATDPEFAARTAWWDNWFAPWTDEMAQAEPSADVWRRIDMQISEAGKIDNTAGESAQVIELNAKVRRWQWTAGLTSAAAAVTLAFLAFPSGTTGPSPDPVPTVAAADPLMATVPIGETGLRLDVTYLPDSERMMVTAIGLTPDGVHDHELWLVPADGSELQSLGVVAPGEVRSMILPANIVENIGSGVELVLTREPIGGKPEGEDAGPVVAQGDFSQV